MTRFPKLMVAILAGIPLLLPERSWAEVICGKRPPLKPVRCVCGKLVDATGGPVSGALVRVNRQGAQIAAENTDADGKFVFPELKSGEYELVADLDSTFVPFRSSITLVKPKKKCRHELVIKMVLTYPDNCGSYVMKR
jgi:Carboxypeptidase regulatory-like domain